MRRISFALLCGVLGATVLAGWAQSPAAITPHQVATALMSRSISVADSAVNLLSEVPTKTVNPLLEVVSASNTNAGTTRFRLRCADSRDCLPFYAVVVGANDTTVKKLPGPPTQPEAGAVPPSSPHEPWLVHSGERATLVLEGQHLRLQMSVVCLSNGIAGKSIRVTTPNGRHTYRAEVAGPGLLKGGL
jgi:hypothetical protein